MKRIVFSLMVLCALGSCKKDITSINVDTKNPQLVPSSSLFASAQHTLVNTATSSNVNLNIFRLITQQFEETTYTDESNYDLQSRGIPDGIWTAMYRDVLKNFAQAKLLMAAETATADQKKNKTAITDIMEVTTWYYLVTTYGNIPYSESMNIDNVFPKFDDQAAIMNDLLARLVADKAMLNTAEESFGAADLIYNGDVSKWKKYASSLQMKIGMTLADADPQKARTAVENAVQDGVFSSNDDNAVFHYIAGPPNTNPIWVDLVQSKRKDFVIASTIVDKMMSLSDPRVPLYFTRDANGGYSGGDPGASSNYATYSKVSPKITAPDFPGILLSYDEVEFMLAEAVERGYSVPGTAQEHYNNAIIASMEFWGASETSADSYLSNTSVNYLTATGNWKEKIGTQKWIALFNRGWDAWIETRRLDYPQLVAPASAISGFPVRYTYPVSEQNVNGVNYEQAAAAIGGDNVETKLFWDKF